MNGVQIYTCVLYSLVIAYGFKERSIFLAVLLDVPLIGRVLGWW